MTRFPLFFLISFFIIPAVAQANPSANKSLSMHHLSITSDKAPAKTETPKDDAAKTAPQATETKPAPKPLKSEDALKKMDGLTEWPYYTDILTIGNDTALDKVIHTIDIDPGAVPPKGLFYLAKALSDRKRYEEAAFYFYAGQLRAMFDIARFPAYELNDKKTVKDNRTEDQKGQIPDAEPVLVNPHESISVLALTIGSPISRWSMADPSRLDTVMGKVREWDLATPYAYLPDYDISHARPYEEWPQLLSKTRTDYFTRVRQISRGLTSVKPVEPRQSFTRP